MSDVQAANLRRTMERALDVATYHAFIARVDGVAAGIGLVRVYDDVGYLQGSAVAPAHRGRGVYRALVGHRLRVLREAGIGIALIHARADTAAPICARLGFRTEFYSGVFGGE